MTGIMQRGHVDVVPGVSIGEVCLGFSRGEVLSVLGPPTHIETIESEDLEAVSWRYRGGLYELTFEMPLDRLVEITSRHRLVAVQGQRLFGPAGLSQEALQSHREAWEQAGLGLVPGGSGLDAVRVFEVSEAAVASPVEAPADGYQTT